MSQQLSFPAFSDSRPRTDRLFFAIFPPHQIAATVLAPLAQQLRSRHGLHNRPLATNRFHITLQLLDDFPGLPSEIVGAASQAAADINLPSFEVVFDRAGSFFKETSDKPFVLRGGSGLADLMIFQKALAVALMKTGLGRYVTGHFTPHVTMLYDPELVPEHDIEPVRWKVGEFTLVHSLLGQSRHIMLARWSLSGRSARAQTPPCYVA